MHWTTSLDPFRNKRVTGISSFSCVSLNSSLPSYRLQEDQVSGLLLHKVVEESQEKDHIAVL